MHKSVGGGGQIRSRSVTGILVLKKWSYAYRSKDEMLVPQTIFAGKVGPTAKFLFPPDKYLPSYNDNMKACFSLIKRNLSLSQILIGQKPWTLVRGFDQNADHLVLWSFCSKVEDAINLKRGHSTPVRWPFAGKTCSEKIKRSGL